MNDKIKNDSSKLQFDTVRFSTSSDNISLIEGKEHLFKHTLDMETGELSIIEFNSQANHNNRGLVPFSLYIHANRQSKRMTIEFSSKLLLEDYPLLISEDTFPQALRNIERLGICKLNVEAIIEDCSFNKLHATKDVDMELTEFILDTLNLCTGDYRRYNWKRYMGESICFKKDVKTRDCQEELNIYNKEVEILTGKNKPFLKMVSNPTEIMAHYEKKTRFELKMGTKRMIMKKLKISDTSYYNVMRGNPNILLEQFDCIFTPSANSKAADTSLINGFTDYTLFCTLCFHKFNLKTIEQDIKDRRLYGPNSRCALGRAMNKVKSMAHAWNKQSTNANSIIEEIREKLESKSMN